MNISNEVRAAAINAYPGATMVLEKSGRKIKCIGAVLYPKDLRIYERGNDYYYSCFPFKLLLKPLSRISDADAVEVAKIMGIEYNNAPDSYAYYDRDGLAMYLEEEVFCNGDFCRTNISANVISELTDFLRSKCYLTKFRGIDLVQAGIAILEEGGEGE